MLTVIMLVSTTRPSIIAYQEDGFDDGSEELISGFFKGGGSENVINVDVCREGFDFPVLVRNSLV